MFDSGEKRISVGPRFHQVGFLAISATVLGSLYLVAAVSIVGGDGFKTVFPWLLMAGLWFGLATTFYLMRYRPLKDVYLGVHGIRVTSRRSEIFIPYEGIKSLREIKSQNPRLVVVQLQQSTIHGRQFTFIPARSSIDLVWFWSESLVVKELRERMATAQAVQNHKPSGRVGRSVMADDERDGPF